MRRGVRIPCRVVSSSLFSVFGTSGMGPAHLLDAATIAAAVYTRPGSFADQLPHSEPLECFSPVASKKTGAVLRQKGAFPEVRLSTSQEGFVSERSLKKGKCRSGKKTTFGGARSLTRLTGVRTGAACGQPTREFQPENYWGVQADVQLYPSRGRESTRGIAAPSWRERLRAENSPPPRGEAASAIDLPFGSPDSAFVVPSCVPEEGTHQRASVAPHSWCQPTLRRRGTLIPEETPIPGEPAARLYESFSRTGSPLTELLWTRLGSRALVLLPGLSPTGVLHLFFFFRRAGRMPPALVDQLSGQLVSGEACAVPAQDAWNAWTVNDMVLLVRLLASCGGCQVAFFKRILGMIETRPGLLTVSDLTILLEACSQLVPLSRFCSSINMQSRGPHGSLKRAVPPRNSLSQSPGDSYRRATIVATEPQQPGFCAKPNPDLKGSVSDCESVAEWSSQDGKLSIDSNQLRRLALLAATGLDEGAGASFRDVVFLLMAVVRAFQRLGGCPPSTFVAASIRRLATCGTSRGVIPSARTLQRAIHATLRLQQMLRCRHPPDAIRSARSAGASGIAFSQSTLEGAAQRQRFRDRLEHAQRGLNGYQVLPSRHAGHPQDAPGHTLTAVSRIFPGERHLPALSREAVVEEASTLLRSLFDRSWARSDLMARRIYSAPCLSTSCCQRDNRIPKHPALPHVSCSLQDGQFAAGTERCGVDQRFGQLQSLLSVFRQLKQCSSTLHAISIF
ncbi:hypothetical protein CSUI_008390 [Cystoisospora suis]|uniref:Uncharacterized protein n=1 Tax=Cystoisospora suis TaxID=483139 RepID=A0A2C6KN16_9APIC|nr:hypothetical protein CSUI_008390 [Cystoisospora suis]